MTAVVIPFPAPGAPVIDGQLALPLTWEVQPGIPAVPEAPRHLRLVGGAGVVERPEAGLAPDGPPASWVARMARAVAEVGAGDRPPGQLTRWVDRAVLQRLAARGQSASRHPSVQGRQAALATERALRQVRAVRVCPITPGVAETSAVLVGAARGQAIAMRFEFRADRWVVTALDLG